MDAAAKADEVFMLDRTIIHNLESRNNKLTIVAFILFNN